MERWDFVKANRERWTNQKPKALPPKDTYAERQKLEYTILYFETLAVDAESMPEQMFFAKYPHMPSPRGRLADIARASVVRLRVRFEQFDRETRHNTA
jgi:hypothetical protein